MNAQPIPRTAAILLVGLLIFSGCGQVTEQLAIDAYNRGVDHAIRGEFDKAIDDFTEALRLNPEDADNYNNRGIANEDNGEQAKADADFAKARELGFEPE